MSHVQQASHRETRPFYALGLRLLAVASIAVMFAGVKLVSERGVHIVEILFFRQVFSMPVAAMVLVMGPGLAALRSAVPHKHVSRTIVGLTGMACNFLSVILLPLAEATTFGFMVPVFATILSAILLHEHVGLHRWIAVLTGFCGILVILQPGMNDHHLPAIGIAVALAGAVVTSSVTLLVRDLSRTEQPAAIAFWFAVISFVPLGLAMIFFARPHDAETLLLLIGISLVGGIGQLFLTSSLKWGPVSLVIPMDYSMIIWTAAMGWLIWGHWPPAVTWAGAAIVAASGLYIAWREHLRLREVRLDRPPLIG